MPNPQQPDLFPGVGRTKKKKSPRRRYVFEALCEVEGLNPRHPGKIGGGRIQLWEKELRDRHGVPDTLRSVGLILDMADSYKMHTAYGGAGMPLTAKALVDAWPRLLQPKPTHTVYGCSPAEQAEHNQLGAEIKKAVRRNKVQRQIAKDIIEEHGGEKAEAVQEAYAKVPPRPGGKPLPFDVCIQAVANNLAPGEIAKRLHKMRQSWLRRHHEAAEAIVAEANPAAVDEAWAALQNKKPLGMKKSSTMQDYLGVIANLVSPGELDRRMEVDKYHPGVFR